MQHIHLIDTSVASDNIGDEIIVEECRQHIETCFPDAYVTTSSGHDGMGTYGRKAARQADVVFLLGTNALSARFQLTRNFIWNVALRDLDVLRHKVVLFGVGANRDFTSVSALQRRLLRHILSPDVLHAVRDSTGLRLLQECGLQAINSGCPTLWRYSNEDVSVPATRAPEVVFTLTKHKRSPNDAVFVDILRSHYKKLHFWPQQPRDLTYLQEIGGLDGINVVPPNLAAYDRLLAKEDVDVIGTRLHGGIRGLRHGKRVIVLSIDNRARDIGKANGLPTLARDDIATLPQLIEGNFETLLNIPPEPIAHFLGQFSW